MEAKKAVFEKGWFAKLLSESGEVSSKRILGLAGGVLSLIIMIFGAFVVQSGEVFGMGIQLFGIAVLELVVGTFGERRKPKE
jgi:hypothetical protein